MTKGLYMPLILFIHEKTEHLHDKLKVHNSYIALSRANSGGSQSSLTANQMSGLPERALIDKRLGHTGARGYRTNPAHLSRLPASRLTTNELNEANG